MTRAAAATWLATLALAACLSACHSPRINVTVENRTGATIDLLEVDYPSASFGADRLAAGADYRYGFQVRGSGPVKVQYTDPVLHQLRQATGPELHEQQAGSIQIVLLPAGHTEFHPTLTPAQ